ncbi:MAG TPA: hypothetical protein VE593_02955 [Nitrososphaeraceae archaeon]|jgi:hypothetical protein|nr:hypothetical protein [Nitrososphaeraceae archaeon]
MTLNEKNSIFRPFLTAGIIVIAFGIVCLWIAWVIGLQEEGEGFRIIGWRFIIGGAISISIGFLLKNFRYIHGHINYFFTLVVRRVRRSQHGNLFKP